jgi:hypothetical protein
VGDDRWLIRLREYAAPQSRKARLAPFIAIASSTFASSTSAAIVSHPSMASTLPLAAAGKTPPYLHVNAFGNSYCSMYP